MSFTPTAEQTVALDAFRTGEHLVVEAGAGTGKTSTLKLMAADTERTGLCIAYNKAIQTDAAKSFPENVACKTAHSLAYGPVGSRFRTRMNSQQRLPAWRAAEALGIRRGFPLPDGRELAPAVQARIAQDTCIGAEL